MEIERSLEGKRLQFYEAQVDTKKQAYFLECYQFFVFTGFYDPSDIRNDAIGVRLTISVSILGWEYLKKKLFVTVKIGRHVKGSPGFAR